jgi:hypothetical protein
VYVEHVYVYVVVSKGETSRESQGSLLEFKVVTLQCLEISLCKLTYTYAGSISEEIFD